MAEEEEPTPTVVTLDYGDYTTLTVNLKGGTVTSWRINNKEQLFISAIANMSEFRSIFGGICFSYPHFGPWEFGPKYGFSRNILWELEEGPKVINDVGDVYAKFSVSDNSYTHSFWRFRFKLSYVVILQETAVTFDVKIENYDDYSFFEFTFLQSALFLVENLEECEVIGLENVRYKDLNGNKLFTEVETAQIFTSLDRLDKLYTDVKNDIFLTNIRYPGIMRIIPNELSDMFLSNPAWEITKNPLPLRKMKEEDVIKFVLISCGRAINTYRLDPKGVWNYVITYQHIKPDDRRIYDIFEGYC